MELAQAINTRHSVRKFTSKAIDKATITTLLTMGCRAPSAMNTQPWAFSVIQDKELLKQISNETKAFLLEIMVSKPTLEKYQQMFRDPDFDVFYQASTLVTIYAKSNGPQSQIDCSLAAQNIMLSAHDLGLGSCWIGFAQIYLNQPDVKERLGVPSTYSIVAPLVIGHPAIAGQATPKKDPDIIFWK